MKKVLFSLALAFGISTIAFAQPELVTGPAITVDKDTHDYGDIAFDANGACQFKVTNTGTEPLIISNCQGSCGCTVPKCDPNPIAPGASSLIDVKYDTKRPGPFQKSVTINSNAVNAPVKVVTIKGNVGPDPGQTPSGAPEKAPVGAPVKQ
ncbi:MAG: DUF1573 domain-containing protein [Flavobacteriales bacterium]